MYQSINLVLWVLQSLILQHQSGGQTGLKKTGEVKPRLCLTEDVKSIWTLIAARWILSKGLFATHLVSLPYCWSIQQLIAAIVSWEENSPILCPSMSVFHLPCSSSLLKEPSQSVCRGKRSTDFLTDFARLQDGGWIILLGQAIVVTVDLQWL